MRPSFSLSLSLKEICLVLLLQFLKCREVWLKGIIDDLDQSNPYEYLKRMADCHRVHLFDVVMQYRAIFYDDTSGHEENTDGGLLYSWAVHRISTHLHVLQSVLPRITEGPNLAIILEQCMVIHSVCFFFLAINVAKIYWNFFVSGLWWIPVLCL